MGAIYWNALMAAPDVGQRVQQGFALGQQQARERAVDNALAGYASNPDGPTALQGVIRADPRIGLQLRQQHDQRAREQEERQRQAIAQAAQTLGPVYRQMQGMPYEQRRSFLQQVAPRLTARGIPADLIAGYDPTDENLAADIALSAQHGGEGFTLSEGQVRYDASGRPIAQGPAARPRYYPVAPGGQLVLDPSFQGQAPERSQVVQPPAVGTIEDGYRFRGGDPANPSSWEPVEGGASPSNGSQTFP